MSRKANVKKPKAPPQHRRLGEVTPLGLRQQAAMRRLTVRLLCERIATLPDDRLAAVAWDVLDSRKPETVEQGTFPDLFADIGQHFEERLADATPEQRAQAGMAVAAILAKRPMESGRPADPAKV